MIAKPSVTWSREDDLHLERVNQGLSGAKKYYHLAANLTNHICKWGSVGLYLVPINTHLSTCGLPLLRTATNNYNAFN